jgi:DNA-binding NtrC family response regulator
MVRILFIDDDIQAHKTLSFVLPEQFALASAYTGAQGLTMLTAEKPDVVLLDVGLPDMDGMAVLRQVLARPAAPPVVMLTAHTEARTVKEAVQAGAYDYVTKPYDLSELEGTLRAAVRHADARAAADAAAPSGLPSGDGCLIGESGAMRAVKELIRRYGPSDAPVLIQGESGTGKEIVARLLHAGSRRARETCVAVNCGAIPDSLVETELFGAERGAFTDAVSRPGSFEQASGGTLFLDEVGELSLKAQTRLLRVLEQKELVRVGGTRRVPADVRLVAATNKDLRAETAGGGFRRDLLYRLDVLPIRVPPLRDRREDIPLIAVHILALLAGRPLSLSDDARQALAGHAWPGNVRELRNVLQRSLLVREGGGEVLRGRDLIFD